MKFPQRAVTSCWVAVGMRILAFFERIKSYFKKCRLIGFVKAVRKL